MTDDSTIKMFGHVLIKDADSQQVLVDKTNAINFETMSYAIGLSLAHRPNSTIMQMVFGNGSSSVSSVGGVSYLPPNVVGLDAQLHNQTYPNTSGTNTVDSKIKFVDDLSPQNNDPLNNFMRVNHVVGNHYSDIVVTCLLDYNEPSGQDAEDHSPDNNAPYIFDEIGLKTYDLNASSGMLLTHVIFHPVQKALNRRIEVIYTLRIAMA